MRWAVAVALFVALLCPLASAEDDMACLRAVRSSFTNNPGGLLDSWKFNNGSAGYLCSFIGVQCWHVGENKVFSLKLPGIGLTGTFPSGLSACSSLQQLDLSHNRLEGPLPPDLCSNIGKYLTNLDVSSNAFSGDIPSAISACTYLNQLSLRNNSFSGDIPWEIGLLDRLTDLDLSYNNLSGSIPSALWDHHRRNVAFESKVFEGNVHLCGPPLRNACRRSGSMVSSGTDMAIVGVAVVAGFLISVAGIVVVVRSKCKPIPTGEYKRAKAKVMAMSSGAPNSTAVSMPKKPLAEMKLSDLTFAAGGFSEGGGMYYKATLIDGSTFAVKRLSSAIDRQLFISEMEMLGKVRHRNLIPLVGYCAAEDEKLAIYKQAEDGVLHDRLHGGVGGNRADLDWPLRLKIAIGSAHGLAWLHHSCNPKILHCNMSMHVIFLDKENEPGVAGFGLSHLTSPIFNAYTAPEYTRTPIPTVKCDVYSFGVVLLELVTGRKASEAGFSQGSLVNWIEHLSKNNHLQDAFDSFPLSSGSGSGDKERLQVLRIATRCVAASPKDRPTMFEVHQILREIGRKYSFSDECSEIRVMVAGDAFYPNELIVARDR